MEQEETKKQEKIETEQEELEYENLEQAIDGIFKQGAQNIYVQNLYDISGIYTGDNANFESIELNSSKAKRKKPRQENILESEKRFCDWLSDNYENYSMALLIASAVFECLPYRWVVQAADALYLSFEKKKEENEKRYGITDILGEFSAEICPADMNTYTGKVPIEVVRFENEGYQEKILKYVWKECPQLHEKIVLWLKSYSTKHPIKMSRRACWMMGQLAYGDYYYFQSSMVRMVRCDKSIATDILIAKTMISLNEHAEYQGNVHNLMISWNEESNIHYLLTNLLICAELNEKTDILEKAIQRYVCEALKGIKEKRENQWLKNIYNFFASGMRAYTFYRILIEEIYELVCDKTSQSEKRDVCDLFLRLFAVDIDLTRFENGKDAVWIKLCLSKNQVSDAICHLWQMVWKCRAYRQAFYNLMAVYMRKQQSAGSIEHLKKFIKKALGAICTEEIQQDICCKIQRRIRNE